MGDDQQVQRIEAALRDEGWAGHVSLARALRVWARLSQDVNTYGPSDLRLTCVNSVAIAGSRAATGYGNHVAVEMAAVLAERGVATVSGGPYRTISHQLHTARRQLVVLQN